MLVPPDLAADFAAIDALYAAPQTSPATTSTRYGMTWCARCGYQVRPIQYCRCGPPAPASAAKDGPDAAGLEARIREAMKR